MVACYDIGTAEMRECDRDKTRFFGTSSGDGHLLLDHRKHWGFTSQRKGEIKPGMQFAHEQTS